MKSTPRRYTYGEILAVGRRLKRYENLLNNYEQFRDQFLFNFGEIKIDLFEPIAEIIVKNVARYRAIYENMIKSVK